MASTREGAALTEAHRLAQVGVSKEVARDFLAIWRIFDAQAINRSFPEFLRVARSTLGSRRVQSMNLTSAYLKAFRAAEGVTSPLSVARADELAAKEAAERLWLSGPVTIRQGLLQGKPEEKAVADALLGTIGAAIKMTQQASTETVRKTVLRDDAAQGYARVTKASPCYRCAVLAARGAVYKSEMTADFARHKHCNCGAEPVYDRDSYALPGPAQRFADLYKESTADASGDEKVRAFRRAFEGRAS